MVPVEVIQHYPPSDDDVQEPCHLCHDPNMLCCSASLSSILYPLTHAPHPQQQVSCRPATHGLGSYEVQEPPSDLLQLQQARAHCLELSETPHTSSAQCRPPVSRDHPSNRRSCENCCRR